jgi:hypothetical protein
VTAAAADDEYGQTTSPAFSLNRRSVSTISTIPGTVSLRAQSRCSSQANETQLIGWPPAWATRSSPARCASVEVPPTASTTGYTS